MIRRPPRSTRTDTLFPYTTLFRSADGWPSSRWCRRRRGIQSGLDGVWEDTSAGVQTRTRPRSSRLRQRSLRSRAGCPSTRTRDASYVRTSFGRLPIVDAGRSEERRGGKGWVRTCRVRGGPYHNTKKKKTMYEKGERK